MLPGICERNYRSFCLTNLRNPRRMTNLLALWILPLFLGVCTADSPIPPPANTTAVHKAMGEKDFLIVLMDYFNLTETKEMNCLRATGQTDPNMLFPGGCELVVEARLCLLDEKTLKVSETDGQCVGFPAVRVWRGEKRGVGASSGHPAATLSCVNWALGKDLVVFSADPDPNLKEDPFYPKNAAVEKEGLGCIAWATTERIDAKTKSLIDRGYFQLSAKFSQLKQQYAEPITDLLPMASQSYYLGPRLHLAFFNGDNPCKLNACAHLEFRFGVFTESGSAPHANAAILQPAVQEHTR